MGKPAARLGDSTAHGGVITGPGCPTVLIGGMPAATLGDMHVCPMMTPGTPPIPHVGGPVSMGSAGVFIGGKPAARMGDMAVCAGSPDSIIMGCTTVLIGEAGGGAGSSGAGALGQSASGGSGKAAVAAKISAAIANPQPTAQGDHKLNIAFVDKANNPVSGVKYTLDCPDAKKQHGVTAGSLKRNSVAPGNYTVHLVHP